MSTAPIISATNVTASNPAVNQANGTGDSSGESFSQALSREVNNRSDNGNNSSSTNSSGNAQSSTTSSTSTSSTSSSSGTSNGKTGKTSSSTSSNTNATTDPGAANSAQILALVTNVQQTGNNNATANNSTANSKDVGAISGTSASLPATASTLATTTAFPTQFSADAAAAAATAKPVASDAEMKEAKLAETVPEAVANEDTSSGAAGQTQESSSPTVPLSQNAVASPANFAAVEKTVQADIAALDNAATKVQQTVQTPQPVAVATAQQMTGNAQALNNSVSNNVSPQVGSTGWDQALGQKVVWMVAGGQQSASLTLNPPDLGPMQVVLNVTNSHATVTFTAAQPEVRQALENAMPKLREMLGDAGIQLGQASINSGSAQQQNMASQQNSGNSNSRNSDSGDDSVNAAISTISRASPVSVGLGLVDTFA